MFLGTAALLLAMLAWWSARELAARNQLAAVTTERDLARLETRSLRNELAAERLLSAHERARAEAFADTDAQWLSPVSDAAPAACGVVLMHPLARDGLFLSAGLPVLASGESYALFVQTLDRAAETYGTRLATANTLPADRRVRLTFTLPANLTGDTFRFTLVRRSSDGTIPLLVTEPH